MKLVLPLIFLFTVFSNVYAEPREMFFSLYSNNGAIGQTDHALCKMQNNGNFLEVANSPSDKGEVSWKSNIDRCDVIICTLERSDADSRVRSDEEVTFFRPCDDHYRFNVGGPSYTDKLGNVWQPDGGAEKNTGVSDSGDRSISGTDDDLLYQTNRYANTGSVKIRVPVNNGNYLVLLLFSEKWDAMFAKGARLMDVNINGQKLISSLDVFSEVGANSALVKNLSTTVEDGYLEIEILSVKGTPMLSGIEIIPVIDKPTNLRLGVR